MQILKLDLKNCYGIQELSHQFDFSEGTVEKPKARAYAIYAPNGVMKTSFAKTFELLSNGDVPKEERYNRVSSYTITADGVALSKEKIFVLKSEIDISTDSPAITNILVNPTHKARYDELLIDLDKQKNKLIGALQKQSKEKKGDIEKKLLDDWSATNFPDCIKQILEMQIAGDLTPYEYATIFDPKVVEILKSPDFISKANEFNERYQELFDQVGTIYQKGIFNPAKAETSFSTLEKQGYFTGGHRVHLKGEDVSIDKAALDIKLQEIHARIDADESLKKLRTNLAKNAQTQALTELIENLSADSIDFLLEKLKLENQQQFRKDLWADYVKKCVEANSYIETYDACRDEILQIENEAAIAAPKWIEAVKLFNVRFIEMPFTLSIANQAQAALGKENAKLNFTFRDGADSVDWSRAEIKTLSQGEKRALYLLNFIFEVEARKLANQETLFIIDDAADSFDYKNKHAIIQYLMDLCDTNFFHQIILTHNYDFFRSLASSFVQYSRCLMTNKAGNSISLVKADGIKNYFIGKWKNNISSNNAILCATIPFTRNLLEYTKGEQDPDYLKLTSLLHWKNDTAQITVGDYFDIYHRLFGIPLDTSNTQTVKDLLLAEAQTICNRAAHDGLNLEDKVLLSIAIRLRAEIFVTEKIRVIKNDANYWCSSKNQFGNMMKEFSSLAPTAPELSTLEQVSITVSSNIHLNSFMYEPILDLTIEHLISLYNEVSGLQV